jgi:hypothetical protein
MRVIQDLPALVSVATDEDDAARADVHKVFLFCELA